MGSRRLALRRSVRGVRRTGIRSVRRRVTPLLIRRGGWRTWLVAGLAAAALAGALFLGYQLWPAPTREAIVMLKHGTVEQSVLTDALLARSEQVVTAPIAGDVSRLVAEGERVRVGAPVVRVTAGGAPAPGAEPGALPAPGGEPGALPAPGAEPGALPGAIAGGDREVMAEAVRRMDARLYQMAAGRNEAQAEGDAAAVTRLQAEMDATAGRQADLVRQLNGGPGAGLTGATAPPGGVRAAIAAAAPPTGGTHPLAPAGIRDGAVATESAGVLVYHTDGLEEALNPARADAWTPSWFRTLAVPLQRRTGEGQVAAGAPLFKVVDNISQGLVLVAPADAVTSLSTGRWVQLRFTGRSGLIDARVTRMVREGSDVLLHLMAPALPEDLAGRRKVQVALVLTAYTGKVVPRSAIDVRDGLQGVWIWEGREPTFRPAPVIGGNQQELVLETDLPDGTRILRIAPRSMR